MTCLIKKILEVSQTHIYIYNEKLLYILEINSLKNV